ncbi:MAG TPA: response regulator [Tenuifilaceae bacterium]|nr:response regulator [Tenuifilaceae bacterium]
MQNILILKSNSSQVNFWENIILNSNYHVLTVDNALKVVKTLREHTIDFFITDILSPELNGIALISYVRFNYPKIKIIAIPYDEQNEVSDFFADASIQGAHFVLKNPISEETINLLTEYINSNSASK